MTYYRDLNKELIEQVQTMRINIKLYCDEIVQLKGELMEKHETSVILRKECYNWAVENFMHLIQTVQPDSDILPVLQKYVPAARERETKSSSTISTRLTTSRTPQISRMSSGSEERSSRSSRRRSSLLAAEFQRSNSILTTRKSVCSTSPIRRSSSDSRDEEEEQEDEEEKDEEEEREQDVEGVENDKEQETAVEEEPQEPELSENVNENEEKREEILGIIFEDSEDIDEEEEEEKEEDEEEDDDVQETNDENNMESTYDSVEEITIADNTISTTRHSNTFKDITNIILAAPSTQISTKDNTTPPKPIRKRGRPRKNKTTNSFDQENTTDSEIELTVTERVGGGRLKHHTRLVDHSETLQDPRQCNDMNISLRNRSIPITQAFDQSCEEVATSLAEYTDMTLGNFKDAACSTPNSRHNSLRKPTKPATITMTNLVTEIESGGSASDSSSRRPSRRCKPTVLAEPELRGKLRNETKKKSLSSQRKQLKKPKAKK